MITKDWFAFWLMALVHECFYSQHATAEDELISSQGLTYYLYKTYWPYPIGDESLSMCCRCNNLIGTYDVFRQDNLVETFPCPEFMKDSSTYRCSHVGYGNGNFGNYSCRKDGQTTKSFWHRYGFCKRSSPKCKQSCNGDQAQFCVVTPENPDGKACTLPPNCEETFARAYRFCPGNHGSFCNAVKYGLQNVGAQITERECPENGSSAFMYMNGQKLHLMQSVVANRSALRFDFVCPAGPPWDKLLAKIHIASLNKIYESNVRQTCNASGYITDKLFYIAPIHVALKAALDVTTLPNYISGTTVNYVVFFKEKLILSYLYDKLNSSVIAVKVNMPAWMDDHFELNVEATLDDEKLKLEDFIIPVKKSGLLRVKLSQTYFRCVPHVRIPGPDLETTADVVVSTTAPDVTECAGDCKTSKQPAGAAPNRPVKLNEGDASSARFLQIMILIGVAFVLIVIVTTAVVLGRYSDTRNAPMQSKKASVQRNRKSGNSLKEKPLSVETKTDFKNVSVNASSRSDKPATDSKKKKSTSNCPVRKSKKSTM